MSPHFVTCTLDVNGIGMFTMPHHLLLPGAAVAPAALADVYVLLFCSRC